MNYRKLVLKRLPDMQNQFALYDAETNQILAAQTKVEIISVPDQQVKVVIEFVVASNDDFRIESK